MPMMTTFQGLLELLDNDNKQTILFYGTQGAATFGGNGWSGNVLLKDSAGQQRLRVQVPGITGFTASGTETFNLSAGYGWLKLMSGGSPTVVLNGSQAMLTLGDNGKTGEIYLKEDDGTTRVRINGYEGKLHLHDASGAAKAVLGPEGGKVKHWTLRLYDEKGHNLATLGRNGNLTLGGGTARRNTGHDGDLLIRDNQGRDRIHLDGQGGDILLKDQTGSNRIKLAGDEGDIILSNADCAEEFDTRDDASCAGSVMVTSEGGSIERATRPYDRRVVGVISGAGGYKPGLVLGHVKSSHRRVPVAVLGRVCCLADASHGPIEPGDLLTTSATPGHAMRVTDYTAAMGAVLGKALSPLPAGQGLVETLVSLR